ncbi:superoxide dismutase family protein [Virgibacillus flavescens]|uniref:superoxide dismutase family protein n=1 Tax=Virgibacillus flavescens TaxID=1611422 RepID=UPI003D34FF68
MRYLLIVLFSLALIGCQSNARTTLEVDMYNAASDKVGTATFNEEPGGVSIKLKVEGLSPGLHGIHVHEFPKCEGPDFKSAGSHFNPEGKDHGLLITDGPHTGDLPNVEADDEGIVDVELMLAEATLLEGKTSLLKGGGKSLIIHSGVDDGISQPSGDSGERLVCGKIMSKAEAKDKSSDPTENEEEKK